MFMIPWTQLEAPHVHGTLDTARDSSCSWYPGHSKRLLMFMASWTQLETPHVHGTLDTAKDSSCSWYPGHS